MNFQSVGFVEVLMQFYIGNSSQVSDGAGVVLLMKRAVAMQKGLPILGVFRLELWSHFEFFLSLMEWNLFILICTKLIALHWSFHRSFTVVGFDPAVMGVGPVVVIPTTMKATGLEIDDIDLFEINEVKYGVYL